MTYVSTAGTLIDKVPIGLMLSGRTYVPTDKLSIERSSRRGIIMLNVSTVMAGVAVGRGKRGVGARVRVAVAEIGGVVTKVGAALAVGSNVGALVAVDDGP